jgi:hypothetical protein
MKTGWKHYAHEFAPTKAWYVFTIVFVGIVYGFVGAQHAALLQELAKIKLTKR